MDGLDRPGGPHDPEDTRNYLAHIAALHRDWDDLEARGEDSVQLSARARTALSHAVRADARHGARVQMPPTDLGPYTVSELALRTLIRDTVDAVAGVVSLRTVIDHEPGHSWGARGLPRRIHCRVSLAQRTPNLPALAEKVRTEVRRACDRELGLPTPAVDIHIEDLHDH